MIVKKEARAALFFSIVISSIVFIGKSPNISPATIVIFTIISILLSSYSPAIIYKKLNVFLHIKLWTAKQIFLKPGTVAAAPLPLFLSPLLVAILSSFQIPFPATLSLSIEEDKKKRFGKKPLTQRKKATILASGTFILTLFALLLNSINFDHLLFIPLSIAVANVLPLPNLLGGRLFFLSPPMFATTFLYTVILTIFIYSLSSFISLVLSMLFTLILLASFYYYRFVQ